jgi:chromosome segregation ATPase
MNLVNVTGTANGEYAVTFSATDLAEVIQLLSAVVGQTATVSQMISRLEMSMASAAEKLDELEATVAEFESREAVEDHEHALSKGEVNRLTAELAALQAQIDAGGTLTAEEEARFDSLIQRIRMSNIPDAVIPEPTGPGDGEEPIPTEPEV